MWKALGTVARGCVLALTGKASDAVQMINDGITVDQSLDALVLIKPGRSTISMKVDLG